MVLSDRIVHAAPETFGFGVTVAGILTVLCFYLCIRYLLRARLIADHATAKIRSAAQGYTELEGLAKLMDGAPIYAPLSGTPCVWYRYKIEKRRRNAIHGHRGSHWETIESGVSDAIFHLQDDTGHCIVDPEGAEVTPSTRLCWRGRSRIPPTHIATSDSLGKLLFSTGDYRFTEQRIHSGEHLYAIGLFETLGSHETIQPHIEVGNLLRSWKKDKTLLLKRFDENGDGEIDMLEWENARAQAEKEVCASQQEQAKQPQLHLLKKPHTGGNRPFILSNLPQKAIITRYALLSTSAALGFLSVGAALTWAITVRLGGG